MGWIKSEGKFNNNSYLIDSILLDIPRYLACYFIEGNDKNALIDASGSKDVKILLEKLEKMNLIPDILIITHAHFDHACGTAEIRKNFPNITVMAGEKGIKSLENSSEFNKPYRDIASAVNTIVDVIPLKEGEIVDLGGSTLKIFETPGHTNCSISILDEKNGVLYVGDSFGYVMETLRMGPFVPPEFSEEKFLASTAKMRSVKFSSVGLSHFGVLTESLAKNFFETADNTYFEWKKILLSAWEDNPNDENLVYIIKDSLVKSGFLEKEAVFEQLNLKWITDAFKISKLI